MVQLPGAPAVEVQRHQGHGQRPGVAAKPGIRRRQNYVAVSFGGRCLRRQCRFRQGLKSTLPNNCAHMLEPKSYDMLHSLATAMWENLCQLLAMPSQAMFNYQPTNPYAFHYSLHPPTRLPTHPTWNPPTRPNCIGLQSFYADLGDQLINACLRRLRLFGQRLHKRVTPSQAAP